MLKDELYEEAKKFVIAKQNASLSQLQRHLFIGFFRAKSIMDELEQGKVVSKPKANGLRVVLIKKMES